MLITSIDNKKIKELAKLSQKKYRDQTNKFVIETENLIEEANKEKSLQEVYLLENTTMKVKVDCPVYYVTEKVMNKIKNVNTSKVVAIAYKKNKNQYQGTRYLMLDQISDPGNLGTIIRSAVAFGIETLIISQDSCDIYNPKVIRATEGTIFKINIIKENLEIAIQTLQNKNINIYSTDVNEGQNVSKIKKENFCIIMGNEGKGISEKIRKKVPKSIYIPTKKVESLNVAVATSIILYELSKD